MYVNGTYLRKYCGLCNAAESSPVRKDEEGLNKGNNHAIRALLIRFFDFFSFPNAHLELLESSSGFGMTMRSQKLRSVAARFER